MRYAEHGMLFDLSLREYVRPLKVLQYDWMHIMLVGGLLQLEVNLAISKLASVGFNIGAIGAWLSLGLV